MKNIFIMVAKDLEKKGKPATASKFYERLLTIKLDELEKQQIKEKLATTYKALGKFKELELLKKI